MNEHELSDEVHVEFREFVTFYQSKVGILRLMNYIISTCFGHLATSCPSREDFNIALDKILEHAYANAEKGFALSKIISDLESKGMSPEEIKTEIVRNPDKYGLKRDII
jgi:hypothetical protein